MSPAFRSKPVSIFSRFKKQANYRQHVRAVMEAAEPRVLLTTYTITTPWTFDNGINGGVPQANLVADSSGNLYGTTSSAAGSGFTATVFEIPAGTANLATLGTFTFNTGSGQPDISPLVYDGNGHLFGTTNEGGDNEEGSVFEVDLTQNPIAVSTIASFDPGDNAVESGNQGGLPLGHLAVDGSGNIYGATNSGGSNGDGTIFEVADPSGASPSIHTLASFDDTDNGSSPTFGVVYHGGELYGADNTGPDGNPEIFKYDIGTQQLTDQVSFANDTDEVAGGNLNDVIVDSSGNLFISSNGGVHVGEEGTIFEIPAGSATHNTLITFDAANGDPNGPVGALTLGPDGNIYGTANGLGENSNSDIFEVNATTHVATSLGTLNSGTSGTSPNGGLTFVGNNIYGTTAAGGANHDGTVFELTSAGPPAKLAITTEPTSQTASGSLTGNIVVDVEDANGNLITNDTSNVTLSIATPSGSAFGAGSTTTEAAVGGVATFNNLVLNKAGTYTLTAADTDSGIVLTPATSTSFTISNTSAAKLVIVTQPATNVAVGANFGPVVVDIEDQYGNLVPANVSGVTLGINSGGVSGETITGTTSVAAVAGVATFNNISMPDDGTYTLSAADSGLTGTVSSSFVVGTGVNPAGPASQVVITNTPTVTPGTPTTVNAALEDQNGNIETSDNSSTITLTINGPSGATTVPLTVTNGAAAFNLSLVDPGNYSFGATSGSFTSSTTSTSTLTYTTPQAVITQPIGVVIAGQKIHPITLTLYNANQIVTNAKSKVTLTVLTPSGAKAYGPVKVTTKTGSATFKNIYFKLAANGYQLEATTPGYGPAYSTTFDVIPAAPKKISFVTQPAPNPVAPGSPFSTSVKIVDAYGNAISNSAIVLSLKSEPKGASALAGTTTVDTANGVADFDALTLETAGNYTFQAADGKLKASSKKFVVG